MYYNSSAHRRGGFKRRFSVSSAPRSWYVKKAAAPLTTTQIEAEKITFASLGLSQSMLKTLSERDYLHATPIQAQAIPHVQAKKDVLGIAQTGTGKTGAFLIPLIERMYQVPTERVLIIVPTRELAQQIADEFFKFTKYQRSSCAVCVGGASMFQQLTSLRRQPRLVVGTPGRLKDLIQRRALPMSTFTTVVLDEVDRMVDMGFIEDIRFLINLLPKNRQSLFFSATITPQVDNILKAFVQSPVTVKTSTGTTAAQNVEQDVVRYAPNAKINALADLLNKPELSKSLIFLETKRGVDKLERELSALGFKVSSIHGDKPQRKREACLRSFKQSVTNILLATDVVARGIDISDISHVINYDEPHSYQDYIHRIGRAGRAGRKGHALTFLPGRSS